MTNDRVNILIVDDIPDKLLSLQAVLEGLGQNIVTAGSGREALRKLTEQDFAVILLDVNMPDMDGFETAALIRQRKKFAHIPIIFITAYADEMHAARGYSLGAVDYILSPVVPDVLRTKVGVFVDLHRKTLEVERMAEERIALAREQALRAAAEEASRRQAFLARASNALVGSLELETTQRDLLRVVVPELADVAGVTLVDEPEAPWRSELAWVAPPDPTVHTCTLEGDEAPHDELRAALDQALASGRAQVLEGLDVEYPPPVCREKDAGPGPRLHAALILPLLARGRTLGALTLAVGPSGRRYDAADLTLAEDLAGRAAISLDNARLYRNIRESDQRKNEFLSMLAHELRNPLAPIRNAVHILKMQAAADPRVEWASSIIDRQVQHIVRMVDDLLDVARITRGKIQLQLGTVDIATVVARAVETSRPLIDERKHELTITLPADPIWVKGDAARLAQVLTNLLNNAAKYTEEGGRIWLTAERSGGDAVLRVRDSGVGIPRELLPSVFDLFTQGNRSLDRSQGGLGIGLTLVRRLVELHGGNVRAVSEGLGKGSEFIVRLPALPLPAVPEGAGPSTAECLSGNGSSCRVLLVEDNADAAESLAALLRLMGHEVDVVYDGASALKTATDFQPDAVLLDIGLPGMDGYETGRRLRKLPGLEKTLLIAVTGYGQPDDRQRSQEAGFDHHLIKPVDLGTLRQLLAAHGRLSRQHLNAASS
ncbi:MAG TPA: response regulator [Gemmataceae bacterium]|nr:response regulator [Gemmataceae bacterium]